MKIFKNNPLQYSTGDVLTPESYNTNISNLDDCNEDIATKRFTRWTNTYQFSGRTGGYTNTSPIGVRTFTLPNSYSDASGFMSNIGSTSFAATAPASYTGRDITFKPDGTKMYILFSFSTFCQIQEYLLSVPWDISTATLTATKDMSAVTRFNNTIRIVFDTTGNKLFTIGTYTGIAPYIYEWPVSSAWSIATLSTTFTTALLVSTEFTATPSALSFSSDGTFVYYAGGATTTNAFARQLSSGFTLSTAGAATTTATGIISDPNTFIYNIKLVPTAESGTGNRAILFTTNTVNSGVYNYSYASALAPTAAANLFAFKGYPSSIGTFTGLYIKPLGSRIYTVSSSNTVTITSLNVPNFQNPRIYIERIIVTGYYTASAGITLAFNNFGTTINSITLPASTDATVRQSGFSGTKVKYDPGSANPSVILSGTSGGTFTINKLNVEIHYISDRLYDPAYVNSPSAANVISFDANQFYVNEATSVTAAGVAALQSTAYPAIDNNLDRQGSTRWGLYQYAGISSTSTQNERIWRIPRNNMNGTLVGLFCAWASEGGTTLTSTITASITSIFGGTPLYSISKSFTTASSGTLAPIAASYTYASYIDLTAGSTSADYFLEVSSTSATSIKMTVYLIYA